jgi:hypothetical protein
VYRREGEPYNVVVADLEEGFRMMAASRACRRRE